MPDHQPSDTVGGAPAGVDFTLGDWLIQPTLNRASRGGTATHLRPQLIDVLMCLAGSAGNTVARNELLERVWPNQCIAESALARCVAELRQALGDSAQSPALIETIPKRGYRLIAPVTPVLPNGNGNGDGRGRVNGHGISRGNDLAARDAVDQPVSVGAAFEAANPISLTVPARDAPVAAAAPPRAASSRAAHRLPRPMLALTLLAVIAASSVLTWLVLRTPAIPKTALAERDPVVLTFANATGDPVFDGTLRLALAIHLEQSPYMRLTPERTIQETLRFLGHPSTAVITPELALQICERLGATTVLHGSITPMGQRYVIGLEAVACASHDTIARAQAEASGREQVLEALASAAMALRRDLGELMASVP